MEKHPVTPWYFRLRVNVNKQAICFHTNLHKVSDGDIYSKEFIHNLWLLMFPRPLRSHNITSVLRWASQTVLRVESLRQVALSTPHSLCHGSLREHSPQALGPVDRFNSLNPTILARKGLRTAAATQLGWLGATKENDCNTTALVILRTLCCSSWRRLFSMIINLAAQRQFETLYSSATITANNEHTLSSLWNTLEHWVP